jgi:hypothetical protein
MERNHEVERVSFWARLQLALRVALNGQFASQVEEGLKKLEAKAVAPAPERAHASGLQLLAALQREGRLVDFLQQDVAGFSDEQVGAAARVVHGGCRKLLHQYLELEPAAKEPEGSSITVPKGFDPQRIRLTGNVAGEPPFRGTVRHHGWVAREIRLPASSESMDPRVLAPAEVEIA